jgi:uncharacterized protein YdhG (YjbR/CyaY superfamily)
VAKSTDVEKWLKAYDNPMKPVVLKIREIILAADPRIGECIKWQAPTFTYEGNLASFFPRAKQHASLMFHQGAKIPGKHARLEGGGDTGRFLKIASVEEAEAARADIAAIVRAWCEWKSAPAKTKPKPKPATKKAAAKPKSRAKRR